MTNARQNKVDGSWIPRVHLADSPTFTTEAEALDCYADAIRRITDLAAQLSSESRPCVKSRAAIAARLKEEGLIRRISKEKRSDLYDDAGITARHYLTADGSVCDVTIAELESLEVFV